MSKKLTLNKPSSPSSFNKLNQRSFSTKLICKPKRMKCPSVIQSPYANSQSRSSSNLKPKIRLKIQPKPNSSKPLLQPRSRAPIPVPHSQNLPNTNHQQIQLHNSAKSIKKKLLYKLKQLGSQPSVDKKHQIYKEVFNQIIQNNTNFKDLLTKIRDAYEQKILLVQSGPLYQTYLQLKTDLEQVQCILQTQQKNKAFIDEKSKKLARKNIRISRQIRDIQENYQDIQENFLYVSKQNAKVFPNTDKDWQFLIAENQNYAAIVSRLQRERRKLKSEHENLSQLFKVLQDQGYLNTVSGREQSEIQDNTDMEQLVQQSAKRVVKPPNVPDLMLDQLHDESLSGSSNGSESND